jgi:signal recognition particle receptor subunit beta
MKLKYKSYQKQLSRQQTTGKNNFIVAYTTGFNSLSGHHQMHIMKEKKRKEKKRNKERSTTVAESFGDINITIQTSFFYFLRKC